jgi:hypothetical protein
MNRYDIEHLIKLWAQEELTPEQAVGQLLLHIKSLSERVNKLEQSERNRRPGSSSVGRA